ncbi:MAG: hypothetical protein AB4911_12375 [Oscillochloridaceae bacterium umkhey_bin13]
MTQPTTEQRLVAALDLADGPFDNLELARLRLDEPAVLRVHLHLDALDTAWFDLRLHIAAGQDYRIMQATDYRTGRDGGGQWEQALPAGVYQVSLSAAQGGGKLALLVEPTPVREVVTVPLATPVGNPLYATSVAAFFDQALPAQLATYAIPDAAVAVVKDGALIFSHGYGFADLYQFLLRMPQTSPPPLRGSLLSAAERRLGERSAMRHG